MPRLLTRISTSGNCVVSAAQPSAPPRSSAAACTLPDGEDCPTLAAASVTAACAPVDDHFRAHLCQPDRGRKPDAARRTSDECGFSCQIEVHAELPNFYPPPIWPAVRQ